MPPADERQGLLSVEAGGSGYGGTTAAAESAFDAYAPSASPLSRSFSGSSLKDRNPSPKPKALSATKSILLVVAAAALYGSLTPSLRLIFENGPVNASLLSLVRQVCASLFFVPVLVKGPRRSSIIVDKVNLWLVSLELALYNAGHVGLLTAGVKYTEATRGSFFSQLSVCSTPVIVALLGGRVSPVTWGSCAAVVAGILFLGADGAPGVGDLKRDGLAHGGGGLLGAVERFGFNMGDIMCLFSAFSWSLYVIRMATFSKRGAPIMTIQARKTLLLAGVYLVWAVADAAVAGALPTWPSFFTVGCAGVVLFSSAVPGAIADVFLQLGSGGVAPATTNVLLTTEPLWAAGYSFALLGESVGAKGLAGISLILGASVGAGLAEIPGSRQRSGSVGA